MVLGKPQSNKAERQYYNEVQLAKRKLVELAQVRTMGCDSVASLNRVDNTVRGLIERLEAGLLSPTEAVNTFIHS